MGMYTQLVLTVDLKRDAPAQVIDTLKHMLDHKHVMTHPLPDHKLFQPFICEYSKAETHTRWSYMLRCDSYYFEGRSIAEMELDCEYKDGADSYYELTVVTNLKNYNDEIALFLDWLYPYVQAGYTRHCGYIRYEENDVPELLYVTRDGFLRLWLDPYDIDEISLRPEQLWGQQRWARYGAPVTETK
jgi:hypothetical protein